MASIPQTTHERLLWKTVPEEATRTHLSKNLLYSACKLRKLKHARVGAGRSIRLTEQWTDEWLEHCAAPTVFEVRA